jgi:hypothetical protein
MIEALLELQFAAPDKAERYRCHKCPDSVKAIRRCQESRTDFTDEDGVIWPMRVQDGGALFSFCPGKATWYADASLLYNALMLCAETSTHWETGGLAVQPIWWIDLVSWFVPRYNESRFYSRAKAILGDGKGASNGSQQGKPRIHNQR